MTLTKLQFLMYFLDANLFPGARTSRYWWNFLRFMIPWLFHMDGLVLYSEYHNKLTFLSAQQVIHLLPSGQLSSGNVMFLVVSVHHSVHEGRGFMWLLPMMHQISLYRAPNPGPTPSHLDSRHGTPQHITPETPWPQPQHCPLPC